MLGPLPSDDDVRRSYHSGLPMRLTPPVREERNLDARKAQGVSVVFRTSKFRPPFQVSVHTELAGWSRAVPCEYQRGTWTFQIQPERLAEWFGDPANRHRDSFKLKFVLDGTLWMLGADIEIRDDVSTLVFTDAAVIFAYQFKFLTAAYPPNHLVTLRNSVDGWARDLFGTYRDGMWIFELDRYQYPSTFDFKFVLDRAHFMTGPNRVASSSTPEQSFGDGDVTFPVPPSAFVHGYDNLVSVENPLEQMTVRSCGREDEDFDVILVGSGMAGGALADALSDKGAKVLILEAGGLRLPVHMNELPRSEGSLVVRDQLGSFVNKWNPDFGAGVHFNLGGRSTYWSGLIPRMRSWEFREFWPAQVRDYLLNPGPSGGPSGYERAERLMRKGVTLGHYQTDLRNHLQGELSPEIRVSDLPRSMHQPDIDATGQLQNFLQRSTGGFSTADLLLDSLGFTGKEGRDHLRVNLHHLATRLVPSGDKVQEVVCQDLAGRLERRYHAQYVVLCCGSLESPRLALNSGLTVPSTRLGVGLTDHPAYFYECHPELPTTGELAWIGAQDGHAKMLLQYDGATSAQHPYNIELLVNAQYWDTRHADDDLWRTRVEGKPARVEIKFIFDSPLDNGNYVHSPGIGKKLDVYINKNTLWETDAIRSELVMVRNLVLGKLGVTGLSTTWQEWEWGRGVNGSVQHAGGTVRMSGNGSGVVDPNLKFESYDNLYCCDVSVFPTIPAANPSLTAVALALRLADTLAARLGI